MNLHAVGFVGDVRAGGAVGGHQVKHPGRTGSSTERGRRVAQNGLALRENFGLHEEIAEGGMQRVGGGGGQHDFGVAGDLDGLARREGDW